MNRARYAAALGVSLAAIATAVASCTSVLSLDAYRDGTVEFCKVLAGCSAGEDELTCRDHVYDGVTQEGGSAWLAGLTDTHCLDTCASARSCLDEAPMCVGDKDGGARMYDACTHRDHCCGFMGGGRSCDLGARRCCSTAGQHCDTDDECCPGAGACDHQSRTCGGTVCRPAGTACDIDAQCCTRACPNGVCTKEICREDGLECTSGDDCCSRFCEEGKCGRPQCGQLLTPCTDDSECCGPDGKTAPGTCAFVGGGTQGVCAQEPTCLPKGADCGNDGQCCTQHCDTTYDKCADACVGVEGSCERDAQCCSGLCQGSVCQAKCNDYASCAGPDDCCSGNCVKGTCGPPCVTGECHDPCRAGVPISPGQCADANVVACAQEICKTDPYCCCNAWDTFCVLEAMQSPKLGGCGLTCN